MGKPLPLPEQLSLAVRPAPSVPRLDLSPIPPRDPRTRASLIDLSRHYNASFQRNWHNLAPGEAANDLASLPTGVQTLAGVSFDVRGLIQVGAQMGISFPHEVCGIRVEQRCRRLHFLHSAVHAQPGQAADGERLGHYLVHYASGARREVPISLGQDLLNWHTPPRPTQTNLVVAWQGTNTGGAVVRLYRSTWINELPNDPVQSVDLVGARDRAAPFLVALTVD